MADHYWYYTTEGILGEKEHGPFEEKQLKKLIDSDKIKLKTKMRSPTRTNNQLIYADSIAKIAAAINERKLNKDAEKAEEKKYKKAKKLGVARRLAEHEESERERENKNDGKQGELITTKPLPMLEVEEKPEPTSMSPMATAQPMPMYQQPAPPQPQPHAQPAPTQTVIINNNQQQTSQALPALVNVFFSPFGQLIQGRFLAFVILFLLLSISVASMLVLIGFFTTPILWLICIIDAAKYKGRGV